MCRARGQPKPAAVEAQISVRRDPDVLLAKLREPGRRQEICRLIPADVKASLLSRAERDLRADAIHPRTPTARQHAGGEVQRWISSSLRRGKLLSRGWV